MNAIERGFRHRYCAYALGLVWAASPVARAASFDVDSTTDAGDVAAGDGQCATVAGQCTLRAAIEEANRIPGQDTVSVPEGTFSVSEPLVVLDSVSIVGASADTTIMDGGGVTSVMQIQSQEVLVITGGDTISSFSITGQLRSPFVSSGAGGLEFGTTLIPGGSEVDGDFLVASLTQGVLRFDRTTGAFNGVHIPPAVPGIATPLGAAALSVGGLEVDFDLFVSSFQPGGGVLRFDNVTGNFVGVFADAGEGGLAFPGAMLWHRFFGEGNPDLLVVSAGTGSVLRFDGATGDFVETLVSAVGQPTGMIRVGQELLVASAENDAVFAFDLETGAFLETRVASGSGGLDNPGSLQLFDGDLFVHSAGTSQILRYDVSTGDFVEVVVQGGTPEVGSLGAFTVLNERPNNGGPIVNMRDVTIANGQSTTGGPTAGLNVAAGATLTLSDSVIRDNQSSVFGGGLRNSGMAVLRRVSVTDNSLPTVLGGGGVTSTGGGIYSSGRLVLEQSLIANNVANRAGGIALTGGSADIINTTVSGNQANGSGGGLYIVGSGRANVTFSTITQNVANLTSDDASREGGGIFLSAENGLIIGNTIVAENIDAAPLDEGNSPDCFTAAPAQVQSERDNLIGALGASCEFVANDPSTQSGTVDDPLDPGLAPLWFYGGPTRAHLLEPGSPAIDADNLVSSSTLFDCREQDQRGEPRPFDVPSACDIGAVELQPETVPTSCIFASESLVTRDRADITSDVYAGDFSLGYDAILAANLESTGDGVLADRARITGEATLQGTLSGNLAGVEGDLAQGASVPAQSLATRDVAAGGSDVTVPAWQSQSLSPGSYGNVVVESGATLVLAADGEYQFSSLSFAPDAQLQVPGTGTLDILVAGNVTLGDRWAVSGSADPLTSDELTLYAGGAALSVGHDANVTGTLEAPSGSIELKDRATVNGCIGGERVDLGHDTRVGNAAP